MCVNIFDDAFRKKEGKMKAFANPLSILFFFMLTFACCFAKMVYKIFISISLFSSSNNISFDADEHFAIERFYLRLKCIDPSLRLFFFH